MNKFILLSLILFVFACNNNDGQKLLKNTTNLNDPKTNKENLSIYKAQTDINKVVNFSKAGMFGTTEKILFQYVGELAVDQLNRVYIADQHSIRVFKPNGDYITKLGREGRGPGEFKNLVKLKPKIKSEKLYVYDNVQQLINVFDLRTLEFSNAIILNPDNWNHIPKLERNNIINDYFILNDSTLLIQFKDPFINSDDSRYYRYFKINTEGEIISDQVLKSKFVNFNPESDSQAPPLPVKNVKLAFPSSPNSLIKVNNELIYTVWTDSILFRIYNSNGKFTGGFYYPFNKSKLDPVKVRNYYEYNSNLFKNAENSELPETWPAIHYFLIDDKGRIWLATITDENKNYEWWILNKNGALISKFNWPGKKLERGKEGKTILTVKNGFMYARQNNSEGFNRIIKYQINFAEH